MLSESETLMFAVGIVVGLIGGSIVLSFFLRDYFLSKISNTKTNECVELIDPIKEAKLYQETITELKTNIKNTIARFREYMVGNLPYHQVMRADLILLRDGMLRHPTNGFNTWVIRKGKFLEERIGYSVGLEACYEMRFDINELTFISKMILYDSENQ